MTYKEFITKAINSLSEIYSLGESKAIAIRLLVHFLKVTEYEYIVNPNVIIPKSDLQKLDSAMAELLQSRPIQYVLGYEIFDGHRFNVCESVLIPRPETEQLVRMVRDDFSVNTYSELKILDACTGSGAIAYSLAASFPKSIVCACDLYEPALKVAQSQKIYSDKQNNKLIDNPPFFFKWDVLSGPPDEDDSLKHSDILPDLSELDILISNPPYVKEQEKDFMSDNVLLFEPDTALFVPDDNPLRFYIALAQWASALLKTGGRAYFEINEALGAETVALFESYGFSDVLLIQDFHNKNRFVTFTKWF